MDDDLHNLYRARGYLPHGSMGEYAFEKLKSDSELFAEIILGLTKGAPRSSLDIDVAPGGRRISGVVNNVWPDAVIFYRPANVGPPDMLQAWIVRCLLLAAGDQREVLAAGNDFVFTFDERKPEENLMPLVNLFDRGQREPVLFLPKCSFFFADSMRKHGEVQRAIDAALTVWEGGNFLRGEAEDAYVAQCFGNSDVFNDEFTRIAEMVYRPMLDAMNKKE